MSLALTQSNRHVFIAENFDFEHYDHKMGIKTVITESEFLNSCFIHKENWKTFKKVRHQNQ